MSQEKRWDTGKGYWGIAVPPDLADGGGYAMRGRELVVNGMTVRDLREKRRQEEQRKMMELQGVEEVPF